MAEKCKVCDGEGWIEPKGPHADGSYATSRECIFCEGTGRRMTAGPYDDEIDSR
jgi:DnaJ-class molecular chaperone